MTSSSTQKFSLWTLSAMVVGSMVGEGIFSLPQTFGRVTGVFATLIAWAVAGVGVLMLALVFQTLAQRKPDLDAGVYAGKDPLGFELTREAKPFVEVVAESLGLKKLQMVETGGNGYAKGRQQWDSGNNVVALSPDGVVAYDGNTTPTPTPFSARKR